MSSPANISWILGAIAAFIFFLSVTSTRFEPWTIRLPLRSAGFILACLLIWIAADLTLRQVQAPVLSMLEQAEQVKAQKVRLTPGQAQIQINSPNWQTLRPRIKVHLPGGRKLPFFVNAGSYAPIGFHELQKLSNGKTCRLQLAEGQSCIAKPGEIEITLHVEDPLPPTSPAAVTKNKTTTPQTVKG